MSDVAIVGIGMHEFGRHDGISGMDQGVTAVRRALADCGQQWSDMEFAVGGSMDGGAADTMVSRIGLTGLPFTNVVNGCATGGTALAQAVNTIQSGAGDLGIAIGFDKHEKGAFRIKGPRGKDWYGGSGLALTTQFFGMKINRYMHQYGITQPTLAKVGAKAFRNGALNPMAWRRKPLSEEEVAESLMLSYPPHPVHVLLAGRRWCGDDPVPCRQGQAVHRPADLPQGCRRAHPASLARLRCSLRRLRSSTIPARPRPLLRPPSRWPASDRRTSTSPSCRTLRPALRLCTWRRTASASMVNRSRCWRMARPRSTAACLLTPTAAALRTASRSVRPVCVRSTRTCSSCAVMPGERQVPNDPKVAYTHVYGAPGISGVTILSR